jgi:hypothetical protein
MSRLADLPDKDSGGEIENPIAAVDRAYQECRASHDGNAGFVTFLNAWNAATEYWERRYQASPFTKGDKMETSDVVGISIEDLNALATDALRKARRIGENDTVSYNQTRHDASGDRVLFDVIKGKPSVSEACASVGLTPKDVQELNSRVAGPSK